MEKETTILTEQSWLDIAIQTSGSLEEVFSLAVENNASVIGEPEVGLKIASPEVANSQVKKYYDQKHIIPTTGVSSTSENVKRGIGNMTVGVDFIVTT
ncbi:hypothetical protein FACS1894169_01130 [Bacteroidia bacterium]|nr:hypothetical protein FACS1894169_01130 [Bacteroidia bacterium]